MELKQQITFLLALSPEELRLVCKALGGRLTPEDQDAARALDCTIARSRVAQGEARWHELAKLKENMKEG